MPPNGAKVWNEELVKALQARADQKRQQGNRNYITFQKAAETITEIRKDIYTFKNGRIVNLPQSRLTITTYQLCRDIIEGKQDVLPPGYVPTLPEDQVDGNPFTNHPYLVKMKIRSGAFAILMAFHLSQRSTMTKDDIIAAGQRFCDEEMEANYHAGRTYGAWSGNATLKKYGLIHVNNRVEFRAGSGFRSLGKSTYELTRDGEKFIEALLDRHPDIRREVEAARGVGGGGGGGGGGVPRGISQVGRSIAQGGHRLGSPQEGFASNGRRLGGPKSSPSTSTGAKKKKGLNKNSHNDVEELRVWAATAMIGNQRSFKVGKQRRSILHDECDGLNVDLRKSGKYLQHESISISARSRELFVTMMSSGSDLSHTTTSRRHHAIDTTPDLQSEQPPFSRGNAASYNVDGDGVPTVARARRSLFLHDDDDDDDSLGGYRLGGSGTPPKRARKLPPAFSVAGAAALERLEAAMGASSRKPLTKLPTDDRKMPATKTTAATANEVIDLVDSDDDDDELLKSLPINLFKSRAKKPPPKSDEDGIDLTEPPGLPQPKTSELAPPSARLKSIQRTSGKTESSLAAEKRKVELTVFVDDRERNRNATPRLMRTELERLLTTGVLAGIRQHFVSGVQVLEKNLKSGDFGFAIGDKQMAPLIERKTVADLVQRSVGKDHWFQLTRMRDSATSEEVCFMLLEGDFRSAVQFTAYGAQSDGDYNPTSHVVDNEESLIRFLGRAILSSKKVRVIQTKDVQGSLRAAGAVGFLAASKPSANALMLGPVNARSDLSDDLRKLGVPWKVAQCVADELGSKKQLDYLYDSCSNDACRSRLLAPLLLGLDKEDDVAGTTMGWSRAIFAAYSSNHPKKSFVKQSFTSLVSFVEDQALLLEKLHSCSSNDEALNSVHDSPQLQEDPLKRVVSVSVPNRFEGFFPTSDGESVFLINPYESRDVIPSVTMQTKSGPYYSDKMMLFILEGSDLVARLRTCIESTGKTLEDRALECATSIRSDCLSSDSFDPAADSCVLVVRGLGPAVERWAKTVGYRSEFRALVDVVLSELSISHNTTILQAVRKCGDLEKILQQLALACYHFHLLAHV